MAMELTPLNNDNNAFDGYGTMTEEDQRSGDRTPILSDDVSQVLYSDGMF